MERAKPAIIRTVRWILLCLLATQLYGQVHFNDSLSDRIRLSNARWTLELSKVNGGILNLTDNVANARLVRGSRFGCLWGASPRAPEPRPDYVGGCSYSSSGRDRFRYHWDQAASTLRLEYTGNAVVRHVDAVLTLTASADSWIDFQLQLTNAWDAQIGQVMLPSDLLFDDASVNAAYIPFQLPGVRLRSSFFRQHRTWDAVYPSLSAFADFVAMDIQGGSFAMYTVNAGGPVQPVVLGFRDDEPANRGSVFMPHAFQTDIPRGAVYQSPVVRVHVGLDEREAILAYRHDNAIDRFPTIQEKLGPRFDQLARAPLVKTDWNVHVRKPIRAAISDIARLSPPVLIHPVAYQPGGHDSNYPDVLPPDDRWGTVEEFRSFVQAAQMAGHLVMPYNNPTWWKVESPTVSNLPATLSPDAIAVRTSEGQPLWENYASQRGFVVSPFHFFVRSRLANLMEQWHSEVPVDFVFHDQIGARPWIRDYNPSAPGRLRYADGWLNFWRDYASRGLITEDGWDRLAEHGIGFAGGALTGTSRFDLREQKYGFGGNAQVRLGVGQWDPYPLATYLMHDKVLFYQHNLEDSLGATQLEVITWNLAFGYMMAYAWTGEGKETGNSLQRLVARRYAGVPLESFVYLKPEVTRSVFGEITVIANWQQHDAYEVDGYRIVPGGFYVSDAEGKLLAASTDTGFQFGEAR